MLMDSSRVFISNLFISISFKSLDLWVTLFADTLFGDIGFFTMATLTFDRSFLKTIPIRP